MYERTTFVTSWYKREFKSWFSSSQGFCEDCWVNDDAPDLFWQGVQMPEVQRHQWKLVKEKLLSTDDYVLTVCSSFIVWSGLFCEGCSICPISPFCQMPPFLLLSWLSGLPSSYRIDYTTQWFPRRTEYTNKQRKSQCFNVHTLKGVVALEIFGKPCGPYLWKILGLEEERHNSCIVILRGDTPIRKGNTLSYMNWSLETCWPVLQQGKRKCVFLNWTRLFRRRVNTLSYWQGRSGLGRGSHSMSFTCPIDHTGLGLGPA